MIINNMNLHKVFDMNYLISKLIDLDKINLAS